MGGWGVLKLMTSVFQNPSNGLVSRRATPFMLHTVIFPIVNVTAALKHANSLKRNITTDIYYTWECL